MAEIIPGHECYWVQPGKFLAGGYPASRFSEDSSRARLRAMLQLGVNQFLDLTQPGEVAPYQSLLEEEAGWLGKAFNYQRCPIRDFSIPTPEQMQDILGILDASLEQGRVIYLHCLGGIGRTGTVVGCHLVRGGMPGKQALLELNRLRVAAGILFTPSPESDDQRAMVVNWK
jgi:hypothetical protein